MASFFSAKTILFPPPVLRACPAFSIWRLNSIFTGLIATSIAGSGACWMKWMWYDSWPELSTCGVMVTDEDRQLWMHQLLQHLDMMDLMVLGMKSQHMNHLIFVTLNCQFLLVTDFSWLSLHLTLDLSYLKTIFLQYCIINSWMLIWDYLSHSIMLCDTS